MAVRNCWKKMILALFALVWSGCETENADLYGCEPCKDDPSEDPIPDSTNIERDSIAEIEVPIAVYGPPCYFDGTCGDKDENGNK